MPTERPILMSAPMVRATLEDRKTQTRRVVKGDKPGQPLSWLAADFTPEFVALPSNGLCPYGVPGDRLIVRETFKMRRQSRGTTHKALWTMSLVRLRSAVQSCPAAPP